jgi:hypothetical protein
MCALPRFTARLKISVNLVKKLPAWERKPDV